MITFDFNISPILVDFFESMKSSYSDLGISNNHIKQVCGIDSFFIDASEYNCFLDTLNSLPKEFENTNREYGDFQTNMTLSTSVVSRIAEVKNDFEFLFEPTCGRGNFILAAISKFQNLKRIVGIEINKPYVFEAKLRILEFFLLHPEANIPSIQIIHLDIFDFDLNNLSNQTRKYETLILGNPPWVTNSELGSIESSNLPKKNNYKRQNGLDAITGKGNFDLGEYITHHIIERFHRHNGIFAFLIKSIVAKNIIYEQKRNKFRIGNAIVSKIDAKKEFNVSVDAALFTVLLNVTPSENCSINNFYNNSAISEFGWQEEHFVYSIPQYSASKIIEGNSPIVWRQGLKHDCSKIMELEKVNGHYKNKLNEEFSLEPELVYGLLKSSDLKGNIVDLFRKNTIVTQQKIGQDTDYIQTEFPKTYQYLNANKQHFEKRKSSIYNNKPQFSIFGIGDYSFKPYKVAISGMYKSTLFSLVLPSNSKPIMLDDTCYFIGFDKVEFAKITFFLLNHDISQDFLKSIIFPDSKRAITKDILMRIDIVKLYNLIEYSEVPQYLQISLDQWNGFKDFLNSIKSNQSSLF